MTGRVAEDRPDAGKSSQQQLKDLRSDLTAMDVSRAHRALGTLAAAPEQAIALFRAELRPVAAAEPDRVAGLLADLDSDDFTRRDRATKQIHQMGEGALPGLHKALAGQPPLEVRRRVEQLLEALTGWSSEQLYALRAAEVLERIGSAEARQVLELLAGGVPESRLTREAKASLQRLTHRPSAAP